MAFAGGSSGIDFIQLVGGPRAVPFGYNEVDKATHEADTIRTFGGEDIAYGEGGDDLIEGGRDDDSLFGGSGNDTLEGNEHSDSLDGGAGDDLLLGFSSNLSPDGLDTLRGGAGDDTLRGDNYADLLTGGAGADLFIAEEWSRRVTETVALPLTDVITDFNPGQGDQIDVSEIGIADADSLRAILTQSGRSLTMTHYANSEAQSLIFRNFTDIDGVLATAIYDTDPTPRFVTIRAYQSESYTPGTSGSTHYFGGLGDDTIETSDNTGKVGAYSAHVLAGPGDDMIEALAGDDFIMGGPGADTIEAGDGADMVSYAYSDDAVTLDLARGIARGGEAAGDVISEVEGVFGSAYNDTIKGTAAANRIEGGAGDDRIEGRGGADTLFSGTGDDHISGGKGRDKIEDAGGGNDTLIGGGGNDTAGGGSGDDLLELGAGRDVGFGETGDDSLSGGAGNDSLIAGRGNDTLVGGKGADLLEGGRGRDVFDGGDGADRIIAQGNRDLATGGAGADTFVLASDTSVLVITDFDSTRDILEFEAILGEASTFAQFRRIAYQTGDDVIYDRLNDGAAKVILRDLDLTDLTAANFDAGS